MCEEYADKISLQRVANTLRVSMPYARMVLDGEHVVPTSDCPELKFVVYRQSDVENRFPEISF